MSDLIMRLSLDATGPVIHHDYYRKDAADALAEIIRLRGVLTEISTGRDAHGLQSECPRELAKQALEVCP